MSIATAYTVWPPPDPIPWPGRTPFLTFGDMDTFINSTSKVGMWSDGCRTDEGRHNCTKVCTDSQLLYRQPYRNETTGFEDRTSFTNATSVQADILVPYNIYNCMVYPYISALLSNENVSDTVRRDAQILADTMHIIPNISDTLFKQIQSTQRDCVVSFCAHTDKDAACDFADITLSKGVYTDYQLGPGFSNHLEYAFPKWSLISEQSSMNIYTDVAGIGVSIAFAIEAAIITGCWLFVWFHRYRSHFTDIQNVKFRQAHYNGLERLQQKSSPYMIRRLAAYLSGKLFSNTYRRKPVGSHGPSVTKTIFSAIASFQSAQCFFLLSMNIAFVGGLTYKGPFMASQSLGQFWNNVQYTQAITQASIAGLCLTQYCLRALGKNSRYSVLLTMVTSLLSISTFGLAWQYAVRADISRIDVQTANPLSDTWQLQCGFVSPQTYNGSLNTYANPYRFGVCIIALALALLVGFSFEFCYRSWILAKMTTTHWCCWCYRVFCAAFEICTWVWIITFFKFFWYPIVTVVPHAWSLGQVLSVLIWVPGLIEFCHAALQLATPRFKKVFHRSFPHFKEKKGKIFSSSPNPELSGEASEEMQPLSPPGSTLGPNKVYPLGSVSIRNNDYVAVTNDPTSTDTRPYVPINNPNS